jgi:hypothetical protein
MTPMFHCIAFALPVILLTGCASTRQFMPVASGPVHTNSARIVVSRNTGTYGWADPFLILDGETRIGNIGPKGQLVWDRAPGSMVITAMSTLNGWRPEQARQAVPLRLGVGAGMQYEINVRFPSLGTGSTPPVLELVSGTPLAFEQGATNGAAMGPECIRQAPGQRDGARDEKTLIGIITESTPVIGIKGYAGQAYNQLEVAADNGEVVTIYVTRKDTVFTDETGRDITGQRGLKDRRVEVKYSALVLGKNIAVSIRYVPLDYVPPASTAATAAPTSAGDVKPVVQDAEERSFTGTIKRKGLANPLWYGNNVSAIFEAVDDTGRRTEFLLLSTSTITDAQGKTSGLRTNKRVEINYSILSGGHRKAAGRNGVVSMRYLD